jgi:hypothetical protein
MARIVYRWRVVPENFEAFRENWRAATNHIHDTVAGALANVFSLWRWLRFLR